MSHSWNSVQAHVCVALCIGKATRLGKGCWGGDLWSTCQFIILWCFEVLRVFLSSEWGRAVELVWPQFRVGFIVPLWVFPALLWRMGDVSVPGFCCSVADGKWQSLQYTSWQQNDIHPSRSWYLTARLGHGHSEFLQGAWSETKEK